MSYTLHHTYHVSHMMYDILYIIHMYGLCTIRYTIAYPPLPYPIQFSFHLNQFVFVFDLINLFIWIWMMFVVCCSLSPVDCLLHLLFNRIQHASIRPTMGTHAGVVGWPRFCRPPVRNYCATKCATDGCIWEVNVVCVTQQRPCRAWVSCAKLALCLPYVLGFAGRRLTLGVG